jgi:crotonobetainyl-CoA:carnitine CoA-transferase CaiB-like acyl-CoA transferase
LTHDDALARLEAAGIANARVGSVAEFVDHPQLRARHRWREIDSPAGPLPALLPPAMLNGCEPVMAAVPARGAQTDTILVELGFGADDLAAWRKEGMI